MVGGIKGGAGNSYLLPDTGVGLRRVFKLKTLDENNLKQKKYAYVKLHRRQHEYPLDVFLVEKKKDLTS